MWLKVFFNTWVAVQNIGAIKDYQYFNKEAYKIIYKVMEKKNKINLFQNQLVRTYWEDKLEKWYFSVQDVVQILSESAEVKQYIKKHALP